MAVLCNDDRPLIVYHTLPVERTRNMNREEAKTIIKYDLKCIDLLKPGRKSGWTCPYCKSGQKANGTGAVKYYPETNTCTCHSCGKSFDVLDIIQEEYACDYNRALEIGADQLNISFDGTPNDDSFTAEDFKAYRDKRRKPTEAPESRPNDIRVQKPIEEDKSPEKATERVIAQDTDYTAYYKLCQERLQTSEDAIKYLSMRGISLETAERCGIGYDPVADPSNFPGLIDDDAPRKYPAKRIILPTTKEHYVGRSISDGTPDKYKKMNNTGGHPGIFNRQDLYAGYKTVFVVEGAFDAMSIIEAGAAAVGINSANNSNLLLSAITERQPTAKNFVICFDNDPDPQTRAKVTAAAESLRTALESAGYHSIIFNISGTSKDANDALCADYKAFKGRVSKAVTEAEKPAPDQLTDFYSEITSERYKPYITGLPFFDILLGGGMIRQTTLFLLAAPAAGKTTLAQQLAEAIARGKHPVIYFNFEMSTQQMLAKDLSRRISGSKAYGFTMTATDVLQGYSWTNQQRQAVTAELEKYREEIYPYLSYNPTASTKIEDIADYLTFIGEQAKAQGTEAPAIIIDYLHLITTDKKKDVQELLKDTTKVFNNYVRTYDTIAIIISATNRESNKSGTIGNNSGRDSSNIEYSAVYQVSLNYYEVERGIDGDAKNKIKVDTPEYDELTRQPWRRMILKLTKNRFGQAGKSQRLHYHAAGNRYYSEYEWLPQDPDRKPFERESGYNNRRN